MKIENTQSALALAQSFADFIKHSEGRRSPCTIEGYRTAMKLFAEFASDGYITVSEYIRSEDYGDVKPVRNYLQGTFSMKSFKENRELDHCEATYKPGFQTLYSTSRD